jgi:hypothetical protein
MHVRTDGGKGALRAAGTRDILCCGCDVHSWLLTQRRLGAQCSRDITAGRLNCLIQHIIDPRCRSADPLIITFASNKNCLGHHVIDHCQAWVSEKSLPVIYGVDGAHPERICHIVRARQCTRALTPPCTHDAYQHMLPEGRGFAVVLVVMPRPSHTWPEHVLVRHVRVRPSALKSRAARTPAFLVDVAMWVAASPAGIARSSCKVAP